MFSNVKIVIADDDCMNRDVLEKMLSCFECTIIKTSNGQEVIDLLGGEPQVDLIILDLEMPVLDGYETLRRIRQDLRWHGLPVIVVTASGKEVARTLELGASDFIAKPLMLGELRQRVMNQIRAKRLSDFANDMNSVLEKEVARRTLDLQQALMRSRQAEYEISLRLGRAAEFRDQETGAHLRCISELSKRLAELAGLSSEECEMIYFASLLHDVGKIGIPDAVLLKPGKLDQQEFEIMKKHTVIGGKIMSRAEEYPVIESSRVIALQHHEKWDGSGYPYGLRGSEIHVFARIVSIVDVFDALLTERPYKAAFTIEATTRIMMAEKGKAFDPRLFDLFFENLDSFLELHERCALTARGELDA